MIGLRATEGLSEHENPGEATVHVLRGRIRLRSGAQTWEARQGDLRIVPDAPHAVEAMEDAAILLTVAQRSPGCRFGSRWTPRRPVVVVAALRILPRGCRFNDPARGTRAA